MKVFALLLLAVAVSAEFDEGYINSIAKCVAGSSLEGRLEDAMKSCSIPGAAASCNEYYKQKHDEHMHLQETGME